MASILVWYLVSISLGSYNKGNVQYSPPLTTLEECQKLQKFVNNYVVDTQCVQIQKWRER